MYLTIVNIGLYRVVRRVDRINCLIFPRIYSPTTYIHDI